MIAYLREMERLNKATAKALEDGMKTGMKAGRQDISVIEPIYRAAEEFAPEYDPDPVFEQVNADNKTESEQEIL